MFKGVKLVTDDNSVPPVGTYRPKHMVIDKSQSNTIIASPTHKSKLAKVQINQTFGEKSRHMSMQFGHSHSGNFAQHSSRQEMGARVFSASPATFSNNFMTPKA